MIRKRKPQGFFSNMIKEQWLEYGKKREYDKLSRSELSKKERVYCNKGREEGWIKELIPETKHKPAGFFSNMTKKQWFDYGREQGYEELSRSELSKKEDGYYRVGKLEDWLKELIPETRVKPAGFFSNMTKEEWLTYGRKQGYDKLTRNELWKKVGAYLKKGKIEDWIKELIPETKYKPAGFFSNMTKKQWFDYGIKNGYDKLRRTELSKKTGAYCQKGRLEDWIKDLIPETKKKSRGFFSNMTKKQWFDYGIKNGYDKITRVELLKKEGAYYKVGKMEDWVKDLIPKTKVRKSYRFFSNMSKEEWLTYGRKQGYDKLSRSELQKKEGGYVDVARKKDWLKELIPETMVKPSGFFSNMTKEQWLAYGREQGYNKLSRTELSKKTSAYQEAGRKKDWIKELIPETMIKPRGFYSNMTKEEWFDYGRKQGYDNLSRKELNKKEAGYFRIGWQKDWIKELIPQTKRKPYRFFSNLTKKQWLEYGKERGFDKLSRSELQKESSTYYTAGRLEDWLKELIPETKAKPNGFWKNMTKEQWLTYGREQGYDKLRRSDLKKKASTYCQRGLNEGWLNDLIPTKKDNIENVLKDYIDDKN